MTCVWLLFFLRTILFKVTFKNLNYEHFFFFHVRIILTAIFKKLYRLQKYMCISLKAKYLFVRNT